MQIDNTSDVPQLKELTVAPCFCCDMKHSTFFKVLTILIIIDIAFQVAANTVNLIKRSEGNPVLSLVSSVVILIIYSKMYHDYRTTGNYGTTLAYIMSIIILVIFSISLAVFGLILIVLPFLNFENFSLLKKTPNTLIYIFVTIYLVIIAYFFYIFYLYYRVIGNAHKNPKSIEQLDVDQADQEEKEEELAQKEKETELDQEDIKKELIPENSEHSKSHEGEGLPA